MNSCVRFSALASVVIGLALAAVITAPTVGQPADTTDYLLDKAQNGSGKTRYEAIDDLGESAEAADRVVPVLTEMLQNSDPQVRWRSARSLGDYGEQAQSAADELRGLLGDENGIVQYHAAVALGKVGDSSDETVDALVTVVTHPDGRVARAAIASLRNLNPDPKHVVKVLDAIMASDDHAVVAHALEAAVERGKGAVPVLKEALKRPRTVYLACAAIEEIGPDAAGTVPELTELIGETKHSQVLIRALLALAAIGPAAESATPKIIPLLDSKTDTTIPVAAAYALGAIGAKNADAELEKAMAKPNPFLEMVAVWSLAKLHPDDAKLRQQAIDKLQAGLKSDDVGIRVAAQKGLKKLDAAAAPASDTHAN